MHRIAIVALPHVVPFDLSVPCEVFERVRLHDDRPGYRVRVCGPVHRVSAGHFQICVPYDLTELERADTILLPGVSDISNPVPHDLIDGVRRSAEGGARIASLCSGAFLLAATGLLDGKRATTHWLAAEELARRFPKIHVDARVLYVDDGNNILTSAGAAAALDLCLHLVRCDYGSAAAARVARLSVMPLEREGGQSQFIEHTAPDPDGGGLGPLVAWLEENLELKATVEDLAERAGMSTRTLNRRFREQMGTTPLRWLNRVRVERARLLLETTPLRWLNRVRIERARLLLETTAQSMERIALHVGFSSAVTFRQQFRRVVLTSPQAYRQAFRAEE